MTVPTTLVLRFPLGRYHATPWGRHVNEGQVELPPSPWRVLRALYAVWKTRVPDLDEQIVHELLRALAVPPRYVVPEFTLGHTRHYYPDSTSRTATLSVDRTLDAFAAVGRDAELAIRWPIVLPADQTAALQRLARALPYLGRADSICEARLDDEWDGEASHATYDPVDVAESIPLGVRAVSLLAPTLPLDIEALVLRPVDVRGKSLLFPASTRFVGYTRSEPIMSARRVPRSVGRHPVEAVRFTVLERVKPMFPDAVIVTDLFRTAALWQLGKVRGSVDDSHLAGRYADKTRMLNQHGHAHYLALPNKERRIGELIVWTPSGLDADEFSALSRLQTLKSRDGMPGPRSLAIRMTAYGDAQAVLADLKGPSEGVRRWCSVTPFIPPRHRKQQRWAPFLETEITRELAHRGVTYDVRVSLLDQDWRMFARYRPSKRFAKVSSTFTSTPSGVFAVLEFDQPVQGPLALGHLSHFGLGMFLPME